MNQLVWAGLATMPLLPVTVVPAGRTAAGLPVGVQIMGPHAGDRTTLAAGACFEALMGGFIGPPALISSPRGTDGSRKALQGEKSRRFLK